MMFDDINVKCQRTDGADGSQTLNCPMGNGDDVAGAVELIQGSFQYLGQMLGRSSGPTAAQCKVAMDAYWAEFMGCASTPALINLKTLVNLSY